MTPKETFSIPKTFTRKVQEAFDKWEKRGLSKSRKICEAIVKLHDEEEKGGKITAFNGQQSKLPMLPPVYEPLKTEDLLGLTYDEKRTILFAVMETQRIVSKSIEQEQKQR